MQPVFSRLHAQYATDSLSGSYHGVVVKVDMVVVVAAFLNQRIDLRTRCEWLPSLSSTCSKWILIRTVGNVLPGAIFSPPGVHCCECFKMVQRVLNPSSFDMLLESQESSNNTAPMLRCYIFDFGGGFSSSQNSIQFQFKLLQIACLGGKIESISWSFYRNNWNNWAWQEQIFRADLLGDDLFQCHLACCGYWVQRFRLGCLARVGHAHGQNTVLVVSKADFSWRYMEF